MYFLWIATKIFVDFLAMTAKVRFHAKTAKIFSYRLCKEVGRTDESKSIAFYRYCKAITRRSNLPSLCLCEEVGTALQESVPMSVIARLDEIKSWQSIKTQIFLEKRKIASGFHRICKKILVIKKYSGFASVGELLRNARHESQSDSRNDGISRIAFLLH